jgi:hypothetical protein
MCQAYSLHSTVHRHKPVLLLLLRGWLCPHPHACLAKRQHLKTRVLLVMHPSILRVTTAMGYHIALLTVAAQSSASALPTPAPSSSPPAGPRPAASLLSPDHELSMPMSPSTSPAPCQWSQARPRPMSSKGNGRFTYPSMACLSEHHRNTRH